MTFVELLSTYGAGILAGLAFLVSLVVELTKNVWFLKNIPTSAYTVFVGVLVTAIAYFIALGVASFSFKWYELAIAILAGFPVSYIAMYGWETLTDVWNRYKK